LAIFCTISTSSHLFKTYALAESIQQFGGELKVLLVDSNEVKNNENIPVNIQFHYLNEINSNRIKQTKQAYQNDKLRWALKPAYLLFLLGNYQKVIYVDNDVYFFNEFNFLLDELNRFDVLLTPHFYPSSPKKEQTWLEANFRLGLYNAGFIGVNKNAKEALEWWSDCCLYELKKAYWRGLFDDQKYLDLFPIKFEKVKIIKDRGCNFAGWNSQSNISIKKIVFVHFNSYTLQKFKDTTSLYNMLYNKYVSHLKSNKPNFHTASNYFSSFKLQNAFYFLKWKMSRIFNYHK
jgi:hypothetical protein